MEPIGVWSIIWLAQTQWMGTLKRKRKRDRDRVGDIDEQYRTLLFITCGAQFMIIEWSNKSLCAWTFNSIACISFFLHCCCCCCYFSIFFFLIFSFKLSLLNFISHKIIASWTLTHIQNANRPCPLFLFISLQNWCDFKGYSVPYNVMFTFRAIVFGIQDKFIDSNLLPSSNDFLCGQNLAFQYSYSYHLKQKPIDNETKKEKRMKKLLYRCDCGAIIKWTFNEMCICDVHV